MLRYSWSIATWVVCLGCGSGSVSSPAPPPPPTSSARVAVPDLSLVPAPADLVLIGRLKNPRLAIDTLANWAEIPLAPEGLLPKQASWLNPVLAWDVPIEVLAALDPEATDRKADPLFVVSVGLLSLDRALSLGKDRGKSSDVFPQVLHIPFGDDLSCAVSASVGPAPARLVCGEDPLKVEQLLPYATRGLPLEALGTNDLELELRAEPIRRRFSRELSQLRALAGLLIRMASLDDKRFDAGLADVTYSMADELKRFAEELNRIQITATFDQSEKALKIATTLDLRHHDRSERSFVSEVLRDMGRRATPPSETFWDLPARATSAFYSVGNDTERFMAIFQKLAELADAYLEHESVPAQLRKRVRRLLETYPLLTSGGGVYAMGHSEAVGALAHLGWSVGVMNQRADRFTQLLADLSSLLTDRELIRLFKTRLDWDTKLWPKVQQQTVQVRGFPARATSTTLSLPAALVEKLGGVLGGGFASSESAAAKSASLTLLVVPDAERSVLAMAKTQKAAISLVEDLRSKSQGTLSSVAELRELRDSRSVSGGFWSLATFLGSSYGSAEELGTALKSLPDGGRAPWLIQLKVDEQPTSLTASGEVRFPRRTIRDIGTLILGQKRTDL